jgi:hypothetical protein
VDKRGVCRAHARSLFQPSRLAASGVSSSVKVCQATTLQILSRRCPQNGNSSSRPENSDSPKQGNSLHRGPRGPSQRPAPISCPGTRDLHMGRIKFCRPLASGLLRGSPIRYAFRGFHLGEMRVGRSRTEREQKQCSYSERSTKGCAPVPCAGTLQ